MSLCVCHILVITFLIVVLRLDFAIPNHCLTFTMKKWVIKQNLIKKKKEKCSLFMSNFDFKWVAGYSRELCLYDFN